jgi:hypothetical protein
LFIRFHVENWNIPKFSKRFFIFFHTIFFFQVKKIKILKKIILKTPCWKLEYIPN